jgi:hypothetical protein
VFLFLSDGKFLKQILSVRWLYKLFDKVLVGALVRAALAMCLKNTKRKIILNVTYSL